MVDAALAGQGLARPDTDFAEAAFVPNEDGGGTVHLDGLPPVPQPIPEFGANLALTLDAQALTKLGAEVVQFTEDDDRSREEWKKTYARGLDLMGLKYEDRTEPWEKACGAFHPLLAESVVRFNAETMMSLFPPAGPVKVDIMGFVDEKRERQAARVRQDMNWLLGGTPGRKPGRKTVKGYRDETDMMLFNLPLAGSTFRKLRFDEKRKAPAAEYILSEHVVMPYSAASLETTPRFALILEKTQNWVDAQMQGGLYRTVPLGSPAQPVTDQITETKDRIEGRTDTSLATARNGMRRLYESHIDYALPDPFNLDGLPSPYVVTVDATTRQVLGVYRNWREDDESRERVQHVVQHKYMPGFGPYGLGLINLIGGLTESATSILRQLVDAGTLSNLPAGFKTKSARIVGDSTPIGPGEWRDVDVGMETLRESFMDLPYKEPSAVLHALLGQIVDEGRRLGSVADMKVADMTGQSMPTGTTLAIIERALKVMSGVQQRLYQSFAREFAVLAEIIHDYMGEIPYPFDLDPRDKDATRAQDYDERVDILPVSDPQASSMAQQIMSLQAVQQLSTAAPQIYDLKALHRDFIDTLTGGQRGDKYVPRDEEVQPADPVTENMRILTQKPVKVGPEQDHEAHLAVHMAAIKDPQLAGMMQQNPAANAIMAAAVAHVQEHLAWQYRFQIEQQLGVPLPPPGEPLPADIEYDLAQLTAKAADKLLKKHEAEAQQQRILDAMQDPVIQNERRALDIDQQKADDKARHDAALIEQKDKDRDARIGETIFREIAETERSTLAAEVNAKTEATEVQLREAEMASNLTGQLLDAAGNLAGLKLKDRQAAAAADAKKAEPK